MFAFVTRILPYKINSRNLRATATLKNISHDCLTWESLVQLIAGSKKFNYGGGLHEDLGEITRISADCRDIVGWRYYGGRAAD
ncbi:hypothetical protein J22TS3_48380 [Paenibacillus sp. J22TS3]|nr:hypothetical protein J22TS3_48380 [Paenibacillus sp. J22TS3]